MKLAHLAIPTAVMRRGNTLRDFFLETARRNVPGLPYVDAQDRLIGRISIRDVYRRIAVPDHLLRLADALGDQTDNLDLPEIQVAEMLALPVEAFRLENMPTVSPRSSIVKALALMEVHNSSYVFLLEGEAYQGVVTRMVIAKRMIECVMEQEEQQNGADC